MKWAACTAAAAGTEELGTEQVVGSGRDHKSDMLSDDEAEEKPLWNPAETVGVCNKGSSRETGAAGVVTEAAVDKLKPDDLVYSHLGCERKNNEE